MARSRTHLSSAVFARWTRFFVQSPVARMGATEDEAWTDDPAVLVAIDLFKMCTGGFWGRASTRVLREHPRLFPPFSHAPIGLWGKYRTPALLPPSLVLDSLNHLLCS